MSKNDAFLASILEGFGPRFGMFFGRFLGPKIHENCKNTIVAKTIKVVLLSRREANFQKIEDRKNEKN